MDRISIYRLPENTNTFKKPYKFHTKLQASALFLKSNQDLPNQQCREFSHLQQRHSQSSSIADSGISSVGGYTFSSRGGSPLSSPGKSFTCSSPGKSSIFSSPGKSSIFSSPGKSSIFSLPGKGSNFSSPGVSPSNGSTFSGTSENDFNSRPPSKVCDSTIQIVRVPTQKTLNYKNEPDKEYNNSHRSFQNSNDTYKADSNIARQKIPSRSSRIYESVSPESIFTQYYKHQVEAMPKHQHKSWCRDEKLQCMNQRYASKPLLSPFEPQEIETTPTCMSFQTNSSRKCSEISKSNVSPAIHLRQEIGPITNFVTDGLHAKMQIPLQAIHETLKQQSKHLLQIQNLSGFEPFLIRHNIPNLSFPYDFYGGCPQSIKFLSKESKKRSRNDNESEVINKANPTPTNSSPEEMSCQDAKNTNMSDAEETIIVDPLRINRFIRNTDTGRNKLNLRRRLMRLQTLLNNAFSLNLNALQYGDVGSLFEIDFKQQRSTIDEFQRFLGTLHETVFQTVIATFLFERNFQMNDRIQIMQHFTHFSCQRKFGKPSSRQKHYNHCWRQNGYGEQELNDLSKAQSNTNTSSDHSSNDKSVLEGQKESFSGEEDVKFECEENLQEKEITHTLAKSEKEIHPSQQHFETDLSTHEEQKKSSLSLHEHSDEQQIHVKTKDNGKTPVVSPLMKKTKPHSANVEKNTPGKHNADNFTKQGQTPRPVRQRKRPAKFSPADYDADKILQTDPYPFCICKRNKNLPMVECDNEDCLYGQWFHFAAARACVIYIDNIENKAKGWICPWCKQQGYTTPTPKNTSTYNPRSLDVKADQTMKAESSQGDTLSSESLPSIPEADENQSVKNLSERKAKETKATQQEKERFREEKETSSVSEDYNDQRSDKESSDTVEEPSEDHHITEAEVIDIRGMEKDVLQYQLPKRFTLNIPFAEWKDVWDDKCNKTFGNYGNLIHKYFKAADIPCTFNARSCDSLSPTSTLGFCKIRGYCQKNPDPQLPNKCLATFTTYVKEVLPSESVKLEFETAGKFHLVQEIDSSRQVRGNSRVQVRAKLLHDKAKKLNVEEVGKVSDLRFLHQNFHSKSLGTDRKIRSEALTKGIIQKKDIFIDTNAVMEQLQRDSSFQDKFHPEFNGFIKTLSIRPHLTSFYSPKQLRYAKKCKVIFLDGTGQLVKRKDKKEVLLHSAVGKISLNSKIPAIPLFEMLSSTNTANVIEYVVKTYFRDMKKMSDTWFPEIVVTDFCLANIHGLVNGILHEQLEDYLTRKWILLIDDSDTADKNLPKEKPTTIFICSGHFFHAVARYLRKHTLNKKAITVALHAFARLVEMSTEKEFTDNITLILSLFDNPDLDTIIAEHVALTLKTNSDLFQIEEEFAVKNLLSYKSDINLNDMFGNEDGKLKREKSVWFQYFTKRRQELKVEWDKDVQKEKEAKLKTKHMNKDNTENTTGDESNKKESNSNESKEDKFGDKKRPQDIPSKATTSDPKQTEQGQDQKNSSNKSQENINPYYDKIIVSTFERWVTYLPLFSKITFCSHGTVPNKTITTGDVEKYFSLVKSTFRSEKRREYEPTFILGHSKHANSLVDTALRDLRSTKPKRKTYTKKQYNKNSKEARFKTDEGVKAASKDAKLSQKTNTGSKPDQTQQKKDSKIKGETPVRAPGMTRKPRKLKLNVPLNKKAPSSRHQKSQRDFSSAPFATARWGATPVKKRPSYVHQIRKGKKIKKNRNQQNQNKHRNSTSPSKIDNRPSKKSKDDIPQNIQVDDIAEHEHDDEVVYDVTASPDPAIEFDWKTKKVWYDEAETIDDLFLTGLTPFDLGNERELLTLQRGKYVGSSVATGYATALLNDTFGDNSTQYVHRVIDTTAIYQTESGFACNERLLPSAEDIDLSHGKIYQISMAKGHAWLTVIDIQDQTIKFYDSLPHHVGVLRRRAYYNTLMRGLTKKLNINTTDYKLEQGIVPEQEGCECVQMALQCFACILNNGDPSTINPNGCVAFRLEILKYLLQRTQRGQAVLNNCNYDAGLILSKFQQRETARKTIQELIKSRQVITGLQKKFRETNDKATGQQLIQLKLKLRAEVDEFDNNFYIQPSYDFADKDEYENQNLNKGFPTRIELIGDE